jgi:hypothetical protein
VWFFLSSSSQIGLNKTVKTLRITSQTNTLEMESMMMKQMMRGMTSVQIEQYAIAFSLALSNSLDLSNSLLNS